MRGPYPDRPGDPCPKCGVPLVDPNPDHDQRSVEGIRRWLRCPVDEGHYRFIAWELFPGPKVDLWPGMWPVGLRCPHCGGPVEIGKDRVRAECPGCRSFVYRDGTAHPCCPECGHRHQSERSIQFCRAYRAFRAAVIAPWEPAGTTEDNEWSSVVVWSDIREKVILRDRATCTWPGCGSRSDEVHHIIPRDAGGSNDPRNLRCLCDEHHQAAHKLIGDGYQAFPKVAAVLRSGGLPPEERAELLAGAHPLVTETRELLTIQRDPNPHRRQLRLELRDGTQRRLEVVP